MTDFNKGDRIRVIDRETGASKTIWVAEDDETGELFTYHGLDPFAPNVALDDLLARDEYGVEMDLPFSEALPTVPGPYEDRVRQELKLEALAVDPNFQFDEYTYLPWTLDETGAWTAPNGERRGADQAWLLVVNGFEFFPWEDRAVR